MEPLPLVSSSLYTLAPPLGLEGTAIGAEKHRNGWEEWLDAPGVGSVALPPTPSRQECQQSTPFPSKEGISTLQQAQWPWMLAKRHSCLQEDGSAIM